MKISEQQLRNIIAESVDSILNERYYDYDWTKNPGGVKDKRVMQAGENAAYLKPGQGRKWRKNDSAVSVHRKTTGGDNAPYSLAVVFSNAVDGDEKAVEQFFQAMRHAPSLKYKIMGILRQNNIDAHANKYGSEWAEKTQHDYL